MSSAEGGREGNWCIETHQFLNHKHLFTDVFVRKKQDWCWKHIIKLYLYRYTGTWIDLLKQKLPTRNDAEKSKCVCTLRLIHRQDTIQKIHYIFWGFVFLNVLPCHPCWCAITRLPVRFSEDQKYLWQAGFITLWLICEVVCLVKTFPTTPGFEGNSIGVCTYKIWIVNGQHKAPMKGWLSTYRSFVCSFVDWCRGLD